MTVKIQPQCPRVVEALAWVISRSRVIAHALVHAFAFEFAAFLIINNYVLLFFLFFFLLIAPPRSQPGESQSQSKSSCFAALTGGL